MEGVAVEEKGEEELAVVGAVRGAVKEAGIEEGIEEDDEGGGGRGGKVNWLVQAVCWSLELLELLEMVLKVFWFG